MSSLVLIEKPRPHVALVTLNNPDRLNAMSFALVEALYAALDQVGRDNDTWVTVLTGRGRAFCALTGAKVGAAEAHRLGLVTRVVADDAVVDEALAMAEQLCTLSPFGIHMTKQTMWANLEATSLAAAIELENRNQLLAGYTGNLEEAKAAFRERRAPRYRD
jgi:enoyl-CoA hydratase/carnithine racemase